MRRVLPAVLGALLALVVSASPAAAIIGGTTAAEPSWPWAVQVVILDEGALNGLCGGTLVTPQRVVTTGNCINGKSVSDIFVVANEKHLVQESSHLIEVSSASLAPGLKVDNPANDVAVLDLAEAPSPADPIQVLEPGEAAEFPAPVTALVAGWGYTSSGGPEATVLKQTTVDLTTSICLGSEGVRCSESAHEPCAGDAGDPVVVEVGMDNDTKDPSPANGTWRLVAMPVTSIECETTIYADLTQPAIRSFINTPPTPPGSGGGAGGSGGPSPTPPLVATVPDTKITKTTVSSTKRRASFRFGAVGVASGFQCALKPKKSRRKPSFKPCTSPKTYRNLAPGRYTFEVRASGAAGPDASPARKSFTVTSPD